MLSAYLYRIRKQLLKKPVNLILIIGAVLFAVGMLCFPMLMQGDEDIPARDITLIVGALNLLLIIFMNFMFFSGLSNGAVGFTNADVNFHLAGPFTPRFNLVIAAQGVLKLAAVIAFVFCCQVSTLSMTLGVSSIDMIAYILSLGALTIVSYALGAFFCTWLDNNKKAKDIVTAVVVIVELAFVAAIFFTLLKTYGSVKNIWALGIRGIISAIGATSAVKFFPVAGWIALIYSGVLLKNVLYTILGIVLLLASIGVVVVLFNKFELNYYETALTSAQKVADMAEAQKAGIDSDSAKINQKIKVGKEVFNNGWGASAFFYRHLHENKRASKFSFINPLALFYRIFVIIYMLFLRFEPEVSLISGMIMMLMLNAVVFGGGKTVLEFNRPYIFMVPEKGSKKVMSCVLASLPEIIFDSIVAGLCMMYYCKFSVPETIVCALMFVVYDVICQLIGVLSVRYMRSLGRYLLMMVRYFIILGVAMIAFVPGMIVGSIVGSMVIGFTVITVIGLVLCGILFIPTSKCIENVDLT